MWKEQDLIHNDPDLSEAFTVIQEKESFEGYISAIVELICNNKLSRENINNTLKEFNIYDIEFVKVDMLDLILHYIYFIIEDHIISEKEWKNAEFLKLYFKIKEGDFLKYRHKEVQQVCQKQYARIISDGIIDYDEELFMVGMQGLFDLGYDQLEKLKNKQ